MTNQQQSDARLALVWGPTTARTHIVPERYRPARRPCRGRLHPHYDSRRHTRRASRSLGSHARPAAVQSEIERCAADEQAIMDAEVAAAAAAAEAQAAADKPIGYDQCIADFAEAPGICADTDGNGHAGPWQPGADVG